MTLVGGGYYSNYFAVKTQLLSNTIKCEKLSQERFLYNTVSELQFVES
jgi:hypothetical protein